MPSVERPASPSTTTEKIVYGEALANVTDDPVTIVDAHVTATGGAAVESTWLAEPAHAVGVLNQWPTPDMVDAFDSGEVRRAPAPLRPARTRSDDGQSLVLFVRMPGPLHHHRRVGHLPQGRLDHAVPQQLDDDLHAEGSRRSPLLTPPTDPAEGDAVGSSPLPARRPSTRSLPP